MLTKEYFYLEQQKVLNSWRQSKERFEHRGNKGSDLENIVRSVLRSYLPIHVGVGHGEIIDTYGHRSKQTDIVISDETIVRIPDSTIANSFIIESVTCVGEVKASLNARNDLEEIIEECRQFKRLSPKFLNGDTRYTNTSDAKRFYEKRPFFVFAIESMKIDTMLSLLEKAYEGTDVTSQIDGIFILERGSIINYGDGQGALKFISDETGKSLEGFNWVWTKETVLYDFVSWLIAVMPRIIGFTNPMVSYLLQDKKQSEPIKPI